jgi:hypothetical protein
LSNGNKVLATIILITVKQTRILIALLWQFNGDISGFEVEKKSVEYILMKFIVENIFAILNYKHRWSLSKLYNCVKLQSLYTDRQLNI